MGGLVVQQVFAFVSGIVIARSIGAAEYGTISVLRNITVALATLTPLGFDLALLKHLPRHEARPSALRRMLLHARLLVGLVAVSIALASLLGVGNWVETHVYHFHNFSMYLTITLLGLPFASDLAVMGAFYKVMRRPGAFALLNTYVQPIFRLAAVIILLRLGWGTTAVVVVNSVAYAVSSGLMALHITVWKPVRSDPGDPANVKDWREVSAVLRESLWMALSLFVYSALRFVDGLVLALYVTGRELGSYGALSTVAQIVQIYPFAMSQTLGPTVARHFHAGDMAGLRNAMNDYIRKASLIGGFVFGGIAGFGDRLDLVFGKSFQFRPEVAILMPLGWLISATLGPMGYSLSMTGRHRSELGILSFGGVILVALCFILVPPLGQLGAATAVVIAFSLINVMRYVYVSRVLDIVPGSLSDFAPPALAFAAALFAKFVIEGVGGRNLITLGGGCVVYAAIFAGIAFVFLLKPAERAELQTAIRRFLPARAQR